MTGPRGASEPGEGLVPALLEFEYRTTHTEAEEPMMSQTYYHRGEDVHSARLTADDVIAIREYAAGGVSFRSLAKRYGVTPPAIANVVRRKSWRHIP